MTNEHRRCNRCGKVFTVRGFGRHLREKHRGMTNLGGVLVVKVGRRYEPIGTEKGIPVHAEPGSVAARALGIGYRSSQPEAVNRADQEFLDEQERMRKEFAHDPDPVGWSRDEYDPTSNG